MINEKFKCIEYYLRDIYLINSENIYKYLTSSEFYFIFNCNKFTYFRKLIKNICYKCYYLTDKIINKECGCKICINCAKNDIDIIVLNNFEKYIYNNKFIECKCGKKIKMIEYESQIYNLLNEEEKEKYKKDSEKRIYNYINDYCMICGENIKEKNYFKFNLKNDNEQILEHLLCEESFKKIDKNNNDFFA